MERAQLGAQNMTVERWTLMLASLRGQPLPPLPPCTGRRCRPLGEIPEHDAHAEAWDEARLRPADTD